MPSRPRRSFLPLAAAFLACAQTADEPRIFAFGMVPPVGPTGVAFTADASTVYFVQLRQNIMFSRLKSGRWTDPKPMAFSGPWRDGDPSLSPDGKHLFFWSARPLDGRQRKGNAIWVCDRTAAGWSEPRDIGLAVNGPDGGAAFASVAADGSLYFFANRADSLGGSDIYRAKRAADGYAQPENLGPAINSKANEFDAYIAPDESYMIFSSNRPGGLGQADLYISERKDGAWTAPRNLGPKINSAASECCPGVSPDGKYFYFTTQGPRNGIFRIDSAATGLGPARPYAGAEPLEEGVISTPGAFSIAFSPDAREAYFAEVAASIVTSRFEQGKWTTPVPLPFCGRYLDTSPSLSPDGRRLLFQSSRPHPGKSAFLSLWSAERTASGWSAPAPLPASINGRPGAGAGSLTSDGTLYFIATGQGGKGDIFRAKRLAAGGYGEPEPGGAPINSPDGEYDVYVTPDERYLLFTSDRPGGSGGWDLYLSERKDGAWTQPRNLGPKINTPGPECCPVVSPDGRLLYFNRMGTAKPGIYEVPLDLKRGQPDPRN